MAKRRDHNKLLQWSINMRVGWRDAATGAITAGEVVAKPGVFELDLLFEGRVAEGAEAALARWRAAPRSAASCARWGRGWQRGCAN